jgi:predicted nucleic acid-binding protein
MKFWDSSAVVPLLVTQSATQRMTAIYREDPGMFAWWGTQVECDSAVARLEREGKLAPKKASEALGRLDRLARKWQEIQPLGLIREAARRFLRVHDLRAADALQLAAAVLAAEQRPATLEFVCLEERLALAAEREGFTVIAS